MMSNRWHFFLFTALLISIGPKVLGVSPSMDIRDAWSEQLKEGVPIVKSGAGFSFHYGGKAIGPIFPEAWRVSSGTHERVTYSSVTLTHASGLIVTRKMRVFSKFGAVEYQISFKNGSRKRLPLLAEVDALDISFDDLGSDDICVTSSGGGMADFYLPPRAYAIRKNCFAPTVPSFGVLGLNTEGGRSSNQDMPFFFIQNQTRHEGIFVAFGWSGQWQAIVAHDFPKGALNVKGKIPNLEIALESGEEIEGPTVLVGLYKGDLADGSNRLRRLIRDEYTPKLDYANVPPVAVYTHAWNVGMDFDEAQLKSQADGAAAIDQEYFILDAGWYAGTGKGMNFRAGLGNWNEVDSRKLPGGLKPVADYVRAKGLKFGLWFEPETVARGTQMARQHPEWILWRHEKGPDTSSNRVWRELMPDHEAFHDIYGVLNYGRPEVQEWVRLLLDRYIRDYGLKLLKYDFNLDPLGYWNSADPSGRHGITQLRHVQGFYRVMDWLRERHPDVVFLGCSSGGLRTDLETVRRFHILSVSDQTFDPAIMRFHLFGINFFLPGNYHEVDYTLPMPGQKAFTFDDLGFQSLFAGSMGSGGRVDLWPEEMKRKARRHVQTWKGLRRYLMEDYYPLSPQPADVSSWSGWQFHDPQDQSGFVQTFRMKTTDAKRRFAVHGLESQARYLFSDAYGAGSFKLLGSEAMTQGFEVEQMPMSSRVFVYRKVLD